MSDTLTAFAHGDGLDAASTLVPRSHRVISVRRESSDVVTLGLVPTVGSLAAFRSGQFNMLSAYGVGEVAISVNGAPGARVLRHSVRDVGAVTHALCESEVGDEIGVRGPFGTDWQTDDLDRVTDVVVVAGGIGLAPLRGAVDEFLAASSVSDLRVTVVVGAREPSQVLFGDVLAEWGRRGVDVAVTVDRATSAWTGHVGLVTTLLDAVAFSPATTRALMCGPEIMMRFTARALTDRGVRPERMLVSLERNMQCGLGWCGHCQLGSLLLCRDGPVLAYTEVVATLMGERER